MSEIIRISHRATSTSIYLILILDITMAFQKEQLDRYANEELRGILANFEDQLKENAGGNGFFVGDKVSGG